MTTPAADALGAEFVLACFWEGKGKRERALEGFERVLRESPMHRPAHLGRVNVLLHLHRVDDAVAAAREALAFHPDESDLHKSLIRALRLQCGSSAAALAEYDLHRADTRPVAIEPGHLLCVSVVRNEAARLPYCLDYYRRHGVDRFLIVDNGSIRRQPRLPARAGRRVTSGDRACRSRPPISDRRGSRSCCRSTVGTIGASRWTPTSCCISPTARRGPSRSCAPIWTARASARCLRCSSRCTPIARFATPFTSPASDSKTSARSSIAAFSIAGTSSRPVQEPADGIRRRPSTCVRTARATIC